jgi:DNA mismatch repair ATPase MutS
LDRWIDVAGEFDALCALAGYAYDHPDYPFPEIEDTGAVFDGEDIRHPLIVANNSVPNSICLTAPSPQLLIVSGTNMSGKSTLLRTVGVNAVMAFAGAPVSASRLRLSPLTIGATLRLRDSIQHGESRFLAEIQRVCHLAELAQSGENVLFLFDEFLSGTNSHDRAIAATEILQVFVECGAVGLVTTHDLALTQISDRLAPHATNVHFKNGFREGRLTFDHRMYPGRVEQSNALALIASLGFKVHGRQLRPVPDRPSETDHEG